MNVRQNTGVTVASVTPAVADALQALWDLDGNTHKKEWSFMYKNGWTEYKFRVEALGGQEIKCTRIRTCSADRFYDITIVHLKPTSSSDWSNGTYSSRYVKKEQDRKIDHESMWHIYPPELENPTTYCTAKKIRSVLEFYEFVRRTTTNRA